MSTHQITLLLCDDCLRGYWDGQQLTLLRRSHRSSYWCEHAVTDDWYPGHSEPVLLKISQ